MTASSSLCLFCFMRAPGPPGFYPRGAMTKAFPLMTSTPVSYTHLQNTYNIYPPISVKKMEYTQKLELTSFLQSFKLKEDEDDEDLTAEEAFQALREKYEIDDSYSDEDARKILIIRNALKLSLIHI